MKIAIEVTNAYGGRALLTGIDGKALIFCSMPAAEDYLVDHGYSEDDFLYIGFFNLKTKKYLNAAGVRK